MQTPAEKHFIKTIKKAIRIPFIILFICIGITRYASAEDNLITVYSNKEIGQINKNVFGNNFIGYDPTTYENRTKEYYGHSDYGAGIWDPTWNESVKKVIGLAKQAGIVIIRFPGGCGTHHYNWKNAIGKNRRHFLYGIDEFLKTCKHIGAEAVITVSYFTGDEQDAADLVEYLNSPDSGKNPNGGIDWAAERAKNGHPEPYNVKYFEIGNEVSHGDHRNIKKVSPIDYARRYLKYYEAMKKVDLSVKIGVVLRRQNWNKKVMEIVKDNMEFGIIHTYPSPGVNRDKLKKMDAKDIFRITLSKPILRDEVNFQDTLKILKEESGQDIPLAITEYNGGFVQSKPVPYRHCLGTALLNAELLRVFMKPEHKILMANYWQFCNSYWGMVANGFRKYKGLYGAYYKRPNYYVFEFYNKHFGDVLIDADVKSDSYDISRYKPYIKRLITKRRSGSVIKKNLLNEKWKTKEFPGVSAEEKDGVLVVDFKAPKRFNYYHSVKRAEVQPNTYYRLSGYIRTEGLVDKRGVCLEVQDSRGWTKTRSAASTEKIKDTTDWQYVDVIYETLFNAGSVNVIARRIGKEGPLKGKAFFKDVKLEKYILKLNTHIPYLSVNASKSKDGDKVYLMVINKNMDESISSTIDLKDFIPAGEGNAWILNGPGIDATNENAKNSNNVRVRHIKFRINSESGVGGKFQFIFEPHSLTAIGVGSRE